MQITVTVTAQRDQFCSELALDELPGSPLSSTHGIPSHLGVILATAALCGTLVQVAADDAVVRNVLADLGAEILGQKYDKSMSAQRSVILGRRLLRKTSA